MTTSDATASTEEKYDVFKVLYGRSAPKPLDDAFERTMDLYEEAFAEEDSPTLLRTSALLQIADLYRKVSHCYYWQLVAVRVILMTNQPEYKFAIHAPHFNLRNANAFLHLDDVETPLTEGPDRILPLPYGVAGYAGLNAILGRNLRHSGPPPTLPTTQDPGPALIQLKSLAVPKALGTRQGVSALSDFHNYWLDNGCFDVTSVLTDQNHKAAWGNVASVIPRVGKSLKDRVAVSEYEQFQDMTAYIADVCGES